MKRIHSGQRSSSQSECEHDGRVHGNTGLEQCIIHREIDSSPISASVPLLQWNLVYIRANLIHRLISPEMNKSQALVNNHFWQLDLFSFISQVWGSPVVGRNSFGQHQMSLLVPFDIPKLHWLFLSVSPSDWVDDNTLLICSVLVLWFWNHIYTLNVWLFAHTLGTCWVHWLLVGFLDVTCTICRCHK